MPDGHASSPLGVRLLHGARRRAARARPAWLGRLVFLTLVGGAVFSSPVAGQGTTSTPARFSAVAASASYSCELRSNGTITCWGDDLGWVVTLPDGREEASVSIGEFSAIATSGFHACGLRTNGTITCWGGNWAGQADPPDGQFSAVTIGLLHSCGLHTEGTITCWGHDGFGQVSGRASSNRIGHFGDGAARPG